MEVGRRGRDAAKRCQPRMAVCTAHWNDRSQNRAATRRADYPHKTFCFVFGLFKNEGLPQGMSCWLERLGSVPRRDSSNKQTAGPSICRSGFLWQQISPAGSIVRIRIERDQLCRLLNPLLPCHAPGKIDRLLNQAHLICG